MLKHFAIHDNKGLHKYLVLSKQRFGAGTLGVIPGQGIAISLVVGVPLTRIPYLVVSSGLSIALWQVKDKHSSYLILGMQRYDPSRVSNPSCERPGASGGAVRRMKHRSDNI